MGNMERTSSTDPGVGNPRGALGLPDIGLTVVPLLKMGERSNLLPVAGRDRAPGQRRARPDRGHPRGTCQVSLPCCWARSDKDEGYTLSDRNGHGGRSRGLQSIPRSCYSILNWRGSPGSVMSIVIAPPLSRRARARPAAVKAVQGWPKGPAIKAHSSASIISTDALGGETSNPYQATRPTAWRRAGPRCGLGGEKRRWRSAPTFGRRPTRCSSGFAATRPRSPQST